MPACSAKSWCLEPSAQGRPRMSKALPTRALATTLLALVSVAAQAQAQNDHAAHGQADAQTAAPSTQTVAPAADPHAGHATSASGSTAEIGRASGRGRV